MEVELMMKYEKFTAVVKFMLILSGLWSNFNPVISTFFAHFGIFLQLFTTLSIFYFFILHISNIMLAAKSAALAGAFASGALKSIAFMWYRDDLDYLNSALSMKFESDLKQSKQLSSVLSHLNVITKLFYGLVFMVLLSALMNYSMGYLRARHGLYMFMFPTSVPFNYTPGGPIYWFYEVAEILANFYVFCVTCGVDTVFGLYTAQMCGELKILTFKFQALGQSLDYKKDLKECIERHGVLINCQRALERVFGFIVVWIVFSTAIIICTLVFQILRLSLNSFEFVVLCGYIILKLIQAFVYALCGQLIAENSATCLSAIYNTSWSGYRHTSIGNDALIIMSQKPLEFLAKGLMYLKMAMFSKIVKTSASYFFLLETLDEQSQ